MNIDIRVEGEILEDNNQTITDAMNQLALVPKNHSKSGVSVHKLKRNISDTKEERTLIIKVEYVEELEE